MSILASVVCGISGFASFLLVSKMVGPFNHGNPGIAELPYDIVGAWIGSMAVTYIVLRVAFGLTKQHNFRNTFKSFVLITPVTLIGSIWIVGGILASQHILLTGYFVWVYFFGTIAAAYLVARATTGG